MSRSSYAGNFINMLSVTLIGFITEKCKVKHGKCSKQNKALMILKKKY